ncbi:hypothetical protein RF11_04626 [Thelohanellus kitauei]|uniref:Uncharacterized protein n=1 Tax=Thelohanellus kitauei TaxID=669202 RepID=A0A0C2MW60_THEKT|nr:hypothetical protein RF11_04626 [Thelohanellus kitauei]
MCTTRLSHSHPKVEETNYCTFNFILLITSYGSLGAGRQVNDQELFPEVKEWVESEDGDLSVEDEVFSFYESTRAWRTVRKQRDESYPPKEDSQADDSREHLIDKEIVIIKWYYKPFFFKQPDGKNHRSRITTRVSASPHTTSLQSCTLPTTLQDRVSILSLVFTKPCYYANFLDPYRLNSNEIRP